MLEPGLWKEDLKSILTLLLAGLNFSFLINKSLQDSVLEPSLKVFLDTSEPLLSLVVQGVVFNLFDLPLKYENLVCNI